MDDLDKTVWKELAILASLGVIASPLAIQVQGSNADIYRTLQPLEVEKRGREEGQSVRAYMSRMGFKYFNDRND